MDKRNPAVGTDIIAVVVVVAAAGAVDVAGAADGGVGIPLC